MSLQVAKGPGYKFLGHNSSEHTPKVSLSEGVTVHQIDGIELTHSTRDRTLFVQGTEEAVGNWSEVARSSLKATAESQTSTLYLSSSLGLGTRVALSLSGPVGELTDLMKGEQYLDQVMFHRDSGRLEVLRRTSNEGHREVYQPRESQGSDRHELGPLTERSYVHCPEESESWLLNTAQQFHSKKSQDVW